MRIRHTISAAAGWLVIFIAAGCGPSSQPEKTASVSPEPVKGTPIRGEPIRSKNPNPGATNELVANSATNGTNLAVALTTSTNGTNGTNASMVLGRDGDHLVVGFEYLSSYNYVMPDESAGPSVAGKDQIPTQIRSLDKKPIALKGYMLPLKVEAGLVSELLLMRDQSMCCYGSVPKINEWVSVKMEKGVKPVMDSPVTIYGNFQVGELRENGYLVGLYQMAGERIKEN